MIHFTCHNCHSRLKAPEARAGVSLPCPSCRATVFVPDATDNQEIEFPSGHPPPVDEDTIANWLTDISNERFNTEASQTKACPYCAETIQVAAMKCRFCGEFLNEPLARTHSAGRSAISPTQKLKDPGLAAVLSFFIPGLGQIYNGQIGIGIIALIFCVMLYFTIIPGLLLHIYLVYDAYSYASRLNRGGA